MTVSTLINRVDYTGSNSTATYAYPFKIFADADLVVYQAGTQLNLTSDYTVTGAGNVGGGNIVLTAGNLGAGIALTILRYLDATQLVDYVANDAFPAETHEEALDRLTMLIQQLQEEMDHAPKTSILSTQTPSLAPVAFATLPAASTAIKGLIAVVTDSTASTWGTTITGGGTNVVLAFCNGAAWKVSGA